VEWSGRPGPFLKAPKSTKTKRDTRSEVAVSAHSLIAPIPAWIPGRDQRNNAFLL
jgi:hypothetical protein